jgi:hypothetical protein
LHVGEIARMIDVLVAQHFTSSKEKAPGLIQGLFR